MRILIHALAVKKHGGMARHLTNFIPALGKYGSSHQYIIYVDKDFPLPPIPPNVTICQETVRAASQRVLWDVSRWPKIAQVHQVDAIWNLLGFGALNPPVPQIMFQRVPGYYCRYYLEAVDTKTRWQAYLRRWWQAAIMRKSAHIITPTGAMRDMIRFHHSDLPLNRFSVLPHAYNPLALEGELPANILVRFSTPPSEAIKLLYVGHILPYKDLDFVLDVFAAAAQKSHAPLYWFLTIGRQDWPEGYDAFVEKVRHLGLEQQVIILGKLPGASIGGLYRACGLGLFPSLCESFGWPMLEGPRLAKPLFIADTPLNREMTGAGGVYYKIGDKHSAVDSLFSLLSSPDKLQEKGQLGYRHFVQTHVTWERYINRCHTITEQTLKSDTVVTTIPHSL